MSSKFVPGTMAGPWVTGLGLMLRAAVEMGSPDRGRGRVRTLDPFDFWVGARSRIRGLGGDDESPHPYHVFHTRYVAVRAGRCRIVGRLEGLRATHGTLQVIVNSQKTRGTRVYSLAVLRIDLAELAANGGHWTIDFAAKKDRYHAVLGQIIGESDASAQTLHLQLESRGTDTRLKGRLQRRMRSARARLGSRPHVLWRKLSPLARAGLVVHQPATIEAPVSQMCTSAQMASPVYADWAERLGQPPLWHRKQWELIYILQALHAYGVVLPGARGLCFGCGKETLPALLASAGCSIVATDLPSDSRARQGWSLGNQHSDGVEQLVNDGICEPELFRRNVRFRPVDMNAIPDDLRDFDFCWSACAYEHLGSIAAGVAFVRNSLACLRPGGLAVHTSELNLSSNRRTIDYDSTVLFRKRDMAQLALDLVAERHWVAPLNFDIGENDLDLAVDVPPYTSDHHLRVVLRDHITTSFGLIVRKASSTD